MIKRPMQRHGRHGVVQWAARSQLRQEPKSLLRKGLQGLTLTAQGVLKKRRNSILRQQFHDNISDWILLRFFNPCG